MTHGESFGQPRKFWQELLNRRKIHVEVEAHAVPYRACFGHPRRFWIIRVQVSNFNKDFEHVFFFFLKNGVIGLRAVI